MLSRFNNQFLLIQPPSKRQHSGKIYDSGLAQRGLMRHGASTVGHLQWGIYGGASTDAECRGSYGMWKYSYSQEWVQIGG